MKIIELNRGPRKDQMPRPSACIDRLSTIESVDIYTSLIHFIVADV